MHTYRIYDFRKICHKDCNRIDSSDKAEQDTNNLKKIIAHQCKTPIYILWFWMLHFYYFFCPRQIEENVPQFGKYAVQRTLWKHQGSATIEAICIMPILLAAFWAVYSIGQIYILENQVYHAAMNTAEELAETAYLTENYQLELPETAAAEMVLQKYLPEGRRIQQYVTHGQQGIHVLSPVVMDAEGFLSLHVQYQIRIPWMYNMQKEMQVQIRQKAYTGFWQLHPASDSEIYVYLAEYSSVYHRSRNCTHLRLSIHSVSAIGLQTLYQHLLPCEYCKEEEANGIYYITDTGNCYHTSKQCSGLKRTVRRVSISEAVGYRPCSRCGQ